MNLWCKCYAEWFRNKELNLKNGPNTEIVYSMVHAPKYVCALSDQQEFQSSGTRICLSFISLSVYQWFQTRWHLVVFRGSIRVLGSSEMSDLLLVQLELSPIECRVSPSDFFTSSTFEAHGPYLLGYAERWQMFKRFVFNKYQTLVWTFYQFLLLS